MKNGSTMNRGELTGNCPVSGGYKEPVLPDLDAEDGEANGFWRERQGRA
jgi:hypothetical protein